MRGRSAWRSILLIVAITAGVAAAHYVPAPLPALTRAEFMDEVRAGHVSRVEIEDQEVILGESRARGAFRSEFDRRRDAALPDQLRALGVEVRYSKSALGI